MAPKIEALKSTTFFGHRLTRRQIADVQETVALFPALSRNELAKTIFEHLRWTTPAGGHQVAACLRMPEHLQACGILTLPEKRNTAPGPRRAIAHGVRSDPQPAIACDLGALEPLSLEPAVTAPDIGDWNALVERHHYLGCPRPFGPHLRRRVRGWCASFRVRWYNPIFGNPSLSFRSSVRLPWPRFQAPAHLCRVGHWRAAPLGGGFIRSRPFGCRWVRSSTMGHGSSRPP